MSASLPVVLLGHGSPDSRSAAGLRQLARSVSRLRPGSVVEVAFLQHDDPGLTGVATELAWAGHREAVLVPAFLTSAFHVGSDVPRAVAAATAATGVRFTVTAPLGPDAGLLDLMDRHLPPGTPIVLASAGTRDPEAQEHLAQLARAWSDRRGADVSVAFAAMAEPSVDTAIDTLEAASGATAAVAAYVLFEGILPDRIAAAAGARPVSPPLGQQVAPLVLARVDAVS